MIVLNYLSETKNRGEEKNLFVIMRSFRSDLADSLIHKVHLASMIDYSRSFAQDAGGRKRNHWMKYDLSNTLALLEKHSSVLIPALGAEFVNLSETDKKKLGIQNGVRIQKIYEGLVKRAKIKEGFVVTRIGQNRITSVEDLSNALNNKKGGIMLQGVYPNDNEVYYYAFGLDG